METHRRFVECFGVRRGARAPGRDRCRRDRPRARQRMAALGSEVTVLEAMDQFLPMADQRSPRKRSGISRSRGSTSSSERSVACGGGRRGGRRHIYRCPGRAHLAGGQAGRCRRAAAVHQGLVRTAPASGSTNAASYKSMNTAAPECRMCGRSEMWCAAHAGSQGQGGGRHGRRPHRRAFRRSELQSDSVGDLYRARNSLGGSDREQVKASGRPTRSARSRSRRAAAPVRWSRPRVLRRSSPRGTTTKSSAFMSSDRWRANSSPRPCWPWSTRRARGHPAHHPRPSHPVRSAPRGRVGGGQKGHRRHQSIGRSPGADTRDEPTRRVGPARLFFPPG